MDIQYFLKVLWRRRWLLAFVTILAAVITYIVVGLQPANYKSQAIVSTGITIEKGIKLDSDDPFVQQFQIKNEFSNLIATMTSRNAIRLLTSQLLIHDVLADSVSTFPFRKPDPEAEINGTDRQIQNLVNLLYLDKDKVQTLSQEDDALFRQLAKAYKYDFERITKKIKINRIGTTDYVGITFTSESPKLSEFIVNTYCQEYIRYSSEVLNRGDSDAVAFYNKLSKEKKYQLDSLNAAISLYRKNQNIVNIEKQTEAIVGQIADLELKREEIRKNISGERRSLATINRYIDKTIKDQGSTYSGATEVYNQYNALSSEVKAMAARKNELTDWEKQQLSLKRAQLDQLTIRMASFKKNESQDFKGQRDELFGKRVDKEIELAMDEESIKSLDAEINRLKGQSTLLVSAEAIIEELEGQKQIVLEEYLQAQAKLNESRVSKEAFVMPITVFEHAQVADKPEPSNRAILSAFAGVAIFSMSTFLILLFSFFDNSLSSPLHFERFANIPLLGSLNQLKAKKLDLGEVFTSNTKNLSLEAYKESLRKIRNNIETSGSKSFLFTSAKNNEGKTFALLSLAYSLTQKNKRILIIDTNFKHNSLTQFSNKALDENPLYNGTLENKGGSTRGMKAAGWLRNKAKQQGTQIILNGKVDIIGNKQSSYSPSEILADKNFPQLIDNFEQKYDYIFLEGAALNEYSDTRELVGFADKVIAIFDARTTLNRTDKESLDYLNSLGDKFMGGILNQVDLKNLS